MCLDDVRSALESVKGVKKVKVSLADGEAVVTYDPRLVKEQDLVKAIKNAQGMHPYEAQVRKKDK